MKIIFFLDYYRVSWVVKLIGCDVGDLIYWGVVDKIKFCVMLDMVNLIFYSFVDVKKINNDLRDLFNYIEEFKELIRNLFIYNDDLIYIEGIEFFFKDDLFSFGFDDEDLFNIVYGYVLGLWEFE